MEVVTREDLKPVESTSPYIHVSELPSKFLSYPEGTKISYRPYSFKEIEQLSALDSAPLSEKLQYVAKGIKVVGLESALDLESSDFSYIMVLRYLSSFSKDQFTLEFDCPSCGHHNELVTALSEVNFNEISEDIKQLPVAFTTDCGKDLVIYEFTVKDQLELLKLDRPTGLDKFAFRLKDLPYQEARELLDTIDSGEDIDLIQFLMVELDFDFQYVTLTCSNKECNKESNLTVEDLPLVATPFRRDKRAILNRLRTSKKSDS